MSKMPDEVVRFRKEILRFPEEDIYETTKKLTVNNDDLARMWATIEKRSRKSDPWVDSFIRQSLEATKEPDYVFMSKSDRSELARDVKRFATSLRRRLSANDLDFQLLFVDKPGIWHGFRVYEDFSEKNQYFIDQDGLERISMSRLLDFVVERSSDRLGAAPAIGKAGKNVRATRFARVMSFNNRRQFGHPLYNVTAAATNAMFHTNYDRSDIRKLVKTLEHDPFK